MGQLIRLSISLLLIFFALTMTACAPIRNSPFSEETTTSLINHNDQTARLLPPITQEDTTALKISLISDSHANYEDLERVVGRLNRSQSNFVVNLGDMTDLGLAVEFDGFLNFMTSLNKPWFTVIGNHDAIGNGKNIYKRLFGSFNYFIDHGGYRFVFFNNNALDFQSEGVDFVWLEQTIKNTTAPVILFQHINPFNKNYFSKAQLETIQNILSAKNLVAVFHGHQHVFNTSYYGHVLIQQVARVEGENYSELQLNNTGLTLFNCKGDRCEKVVHDFDLTLQ
ncbi:MAG: metallophosphoesterase family protein [Bdellovibrionia bacterium]